MPIKERGESMSKPWYQRCFPFYDPAGTVRVSKRKRRVYPLKLSLKTALGEKYLLVVYMGVRRTTAYFFLSGKCLCKQCSQCKFFIPRSEVMKVWKKVRSDNLLGTRIRSNNEGICIWGEYPKTLYKQEDDSLRECSLLESPPRNIKLSRNP